MYLKNDEKLFEVLENRRIISQASLSVGEY